MGLDFIRADAKRFEQNREKFSIDFLLSTEIIRTFSINNFGIWNCDHPQYPDKEISISPIYTYNTNETIHLKSVAVVYKEFNGITQFSGQMPIRVIPETENMIWSIQDGVFYYYTYKDFINSGINRNSKTFNFKMRKSEKQVSSYTELRTLVDNL